MQLHELPSALTDVDIDVLGFDMCLMAGYETLANIEGAAPFTVFSEETVPGTGFPYSPILDAFHSDPAMGGRTAAETIADLYHASYEGQEDATTISAYDLAGFDEFESALDQLAGSLQANLPDLAPAITSAAAGSQPYHFPEMKDLVSFLDSLEVRVTDEGIQAQIDELRNRALDPEFRLRNHFRNGSGEDDRNVSRSSGLGIVLPSGIGDDAFGQDGSRSLAGYQSQVPGRAWTDFLSDFVSLGGPGTPGALPSPAGHKCLSI
ncbi:MAG: hypothetical protein GEU90_12945 [Gemmatimonas sp.]|nr:hypothetical protein [Gemmatimonas sp.]